MKTKIFLITAIVMMGYTTQALAECITIMVGGAPYTYCW